MDTGLGAVVRRARVGRGLTQVQLAAISGIDQPNISAVENGRRAPSADTFHRLLFACGYELVATAGSQVEACPVPSAWFDESDALGEPPPVTDVPIETRVRMLVAVLDASETIVRVALMEFVDLIVAVHDQLGQAEVDHAFGGALALGYIATPRGTVDIDVNVFLPPPAIDRVAAALGPLGLVPPEPSDRDLPIAGIRFRHRDDPFPVDVFPSLDDRYDEIRRRCVQQPFGRGTDVLPFLSAEDLCVFKLSFARPQDWVDLRAIAAARPDLDVDTIEELVVALRGPTMYPRVARLRSFLRGG